MALKLESAATSRDLDAHLTWGHPIQMKLSQHLRHHDIFLRNWPVDFPSQCEVNHFDVFVQDYSSCIADALGILQSSTKPSVIDIGSHYAEALQWSHNERDGVSNHQPHDCFSTVYSGADQRKHQSSASLAFERGIRRWPVNSPHKWPVTRKMFPFDDVIMVTPV